MVWDGVRCRRVARLDTPHEGNIFSVVWLSGSEDGLLATGAGDCRVCVLNLETGSVVRQWDLREKWSAKNSNVLVNLTNQAGRGAEVKCVTVCPSRTELVAVGANDPYVRVYDRRMISCGPLDTSCDPCEDNTGAVAYFVPGHLPGAEVKFHRRLRP